MTDAPTLARDLSLALIPFILSLTVHEYAHAWMATRLGDDTARLRGRLTLSPGAHVDPVGTILVPVLGVLLGGFGYIAWAKPVPFDPSRFRKGVPPRLGSALVGAAGPLSNVGLAFLTLGAMALLVKVHVPIYRDFDPVTGDIQHTPLGLLLHAMWTRNVALALFNLLPFPPLDGHHLLPPAFDAVMRPIGRYGIVILFVVFSWLPAVSEAVFYRPLFAVMRLMIRIFGVA